MELLRRFLPHSGRFPFSASQPLPSPSAGSPSPPPHRTAVPPAPQTKSHPPDRPAGSRQTRRSSHRGSASPFRRPLQSHSHDRHAHKARILYICLPLSEQFFES